MDTTSQLSLKMQEKWGGGGCRVRDPSTTQASFESWLKILIAGAHLHFPTVQEQSSELRWQKLGKLAAHFNGILAVSVHYISIPCKKWSVFRRGEDHLPLNDHSNSIPWPEGKMWFEGSWTEKKIRSLPSPLIFVSTYLKIGMFVNIHNQNKLLLQIYILLYIKLYLKSVSSSCNLPRFRPITEHRHYHFHIRLRPENGNIGKMQIYTFIQT